MRGVSTLFLLVGGLSTLQAAVSITPMISSSTAAAVKAVKSQESARLHAQMEKLRSPDYRTREGASLSLTREPESSLAQLQRLLQNESNPEAQSRLERIVKKKQIDRLTTPCRINYIGERILIKDLVNVLIQQSGYVIKVAQWGESENVRRSVNWINTPFWKALDEICTTAGFTIQQEDDNDGHLTLNAGDVYNPHLWYSGPVRFVATNIGSNRNVQLSALPRRTAPPRALDITNLNFQIQSEPKSPIVNVLHAELSHAVDDQGTSLLPPKDDEPSRIMYTPGQNRGFNHFAGVQLMRAGRNATLIREVRGKVTVLFLAETRPELVIPDILHSTKKSKIVGRSHELTLESIDSTPAGLSVTIHIRQRRPSGDDYSWINAVYQKLELYDDRDTKWSTSINPSANQSVASGSATMTLNFEPPSGNARPGRPAKLQLVEWVTHTRDLDFVFKDIPIP